MNICVKNAFSVKNRDYEKYFEFQPSLNFDQNFPLLEVPDELLSNENKNSMDSFGNPAVDHSEDNFHIPSKRSCSSKEFDFSFQKSFVSARQLSHSVNDSLKSEAAQREKPSGEDFVVPTVNLNENIYGNLKCEPLKDNARSSNQSSPETGNLSKGNYNSVENVKSNTKHKTKSEKIKPTFGNQTKKILKLKDENKSFTKNSNNIEEINSKQVAKTKTASPLSNKSSLKENTGDSQEKLHCKTKNHVIHKTSTLQTPSKGKNQNPSKKSKSSKCKQENNGYCKNISEVSNFEQLDNNIASDNLKSSEDMLKTKELTDIIKTEKEETESENDRNSNKLSEKNTKKISLKISAINSEIHGNFPKFKSELTEKYVKENKKQKRMKAKNTSSNSCNDTQASSVAGKTFSKLTNEQITDIITDRETVIKKLENYKIPLKSKTTVRKQLNNRNISNETAPTIVSHTGTFADRNKLQTNDSSGIYDQNDISDPLQKENIYEPTENICSSKSKQNEQTLITEKTGLSTSDSENSVAIVKPVKSKPNLKFNKHDKNTLKSIKHKRKDSVANKMLDRKQCTPQIPDSPAKKILSKIKNSSKVISCPKSKATESFDKKQIKDSTLASSKKKRKYADKGTENIKQKKTDIKTKSDKKNRSIPRKSKVPCKKKCMQIRNIYESGTWVECTDLNCHKWRWLQDVHDPLLIPHNWICDMNPDPTQNDCSLPEKEYSEEEFIFTRFTEGSVVWARVEGYPWWPAMVEIDPDFSSYFDVEEEESMYPAFYHVVFFGKKVSRAWVPLSCIKPFEKGDSPPMSSENVKYSLVDQRNEAIKSANEAIEFELKSRLKIYSFSKRFSGSWGSCDCEDCNKCHPMDLSESC